MESLQAHLLIAHGELAEPFTRSVVLMVRHGEDGALGLILNRRTSATLKQAWKQIGQGECERDSSIFLGGPCEGPLVALHADPLLMEVEVMPGVYFCSSREKLETLAGQSDDGPARFFAGYSGWSAGQLESEIQQGSWLIVPANVDHVFGFEGDLFAQITRHAQSAELRRALKIEGAPPDPSMN